MLRDECVYKLVEDIDGDGFSAENDCDDYNANIHPNASEICDGIDNNCDKQIDNGFTYLATADGKRVGDECIVGA